MKRIDTETILVNLLKEDAGQYCTMGKIQKLCGYIYEQLFARGLLKDYSVKFAVDFDSIERTVLYNNQLFYLDIDRDIVYLREYQDINDLAFRYQADETITAMIREFNRLNIA